MKYLIISGSPKSEGLSNSLTETVSRAAADSGARSSILKTDKTVSCRMCSGGWGTCGSKNECAFEADGNFGEMHKAVKEADVIAIVTPVYWGDITEGLKNFLDRLRRCEAGPDGALSGKQVLLVASAGGSGRGLISCIEQLDRFCQHTSAVIYDMIGINRWNAEYKMQTVYSAAKALAEKKIPERPKR